MIKYLEGNLFLSPAQTLVNTVNTVGVMGKGIALEFKNRYPLMFKSYKIECEQHHLVMGKLMLYYEADHWILLFPTKEHWRKPSSLDYIEKGLKTFCHYYAEKGITSIAFPKLGCGNGELSWEKVKPLMEKYLCDLPIDIYIYLKNIDGIVPEHKNQKEISAWLKQNARDLSFTGLVDDIRYNYSFVPYSFLSSGESWKVLWNDGLVFSMDAKNVVVSEDEFFQIWDDIRSHGVIKQYSENEKTMVCEMLLSMGYLSKVNIFDSEQRKTSSGYQMNEGSGRIFALNGGFNDIS